MYKYKPEVIDLKELSQREKDSRKGLQLTTLFHRLKNDSMDDEQTAKVLDGHFSKTGISFYQLNDSSKAAEILNKNEVKFPCRNKSIHKMEREK